QCGRDLDVQDVVQPLTGQDADEQQSPVAYRQSGPGPDLAEQVVDGDAEEVTRGVAHLPAVHLAHHLQAAPAPLIGHDAPPSWSKPSWSVTSARSPRPVAKSRRAWRPSGVST